MKAASDALATNGLFLSPYRRWMKSSLAGIAYYSGLLDFYIQFRDRCPAQKRLFALGYHAVVEDVRRSLEEGMAPPQLISKEVFEKEIDYIASQFDFFSIDEAVDFIGGKRRLKRDSVMLTFDDGYEGIYHHAYPILKRKGVPAALYLCPDYVGAGRLLLHDRLFYLIRRMILARVPIQSVLSEEALPWRLEEIGPAAGSPLYLTRFLLEAARPVPLERLIQNLQERFNAAEEEFPSDAKILSWDMALKMSEEGMTVGSHTASHCLLTKAQPIQVLEELRRSKQALETRLRKKVESLAYPDGRFNPFVIEAARACGYRSAVATADFVNRVGRNPYTLGRRLLWENSAWGGLSRCSKAMVACQVKGLFKAPNQTGA
ncbi:MAG TPA: polysaccharide deacetylase family protein [Candidatus Manganitrophaceae bacterium]|nr:polysaccharide deacetylase family protein [Candidatus Manganitrophaceae bacterium]